MNPLHLRYAAPQLDEGLSVIVADGRRVGEVRTWNAGGQNAELAELTVERAVLDGASRIQLRYESPLLPTAALAGTTRIQQVFAGDLGATRWYHLSLSRAEPIPSEPVIDGLGAGSTWELVLQLAGREPLHVGYLFRQHDGDERVDHYVMNARYRAPHTPGEFLELRRLDASPKDGSGFNRLVHAHEVDSYYFRTPYTWHAARTPALAQVAC